MNNSEMLPPAESASHLGFGRTLFYAFQNPSKGVFDPSFPKPVRLSDRRVYWLRSELDAWVQAKIDSRNQNTTGEARNG